MFETVGEMDSVRTMGHVSVVRCPVCRSLLMRDDSDAHAKWHEESGDWPRDDADDVPDEPDSSRTVEWRNAR